MALPATDNFNKADANPIGGNWTTVPGEAALKIVSSQCVQSLSGANRNAAYWNADSFNNDQYSKIKIVSLGTLNTVGPLVRVSPSAETFYRVVTSTTTITISKCIVGSFTNIGTTISYTFATGDTLKLAVVGTTLEVFVNDVSVGTRTDSDIASGSAGIYSRGDGVVDDWEGGNVAAGGSAIPVFMHHYLHNMGR